jgi:arabinoxylan arabinofuranohydrolase
MPNPILRQSYAADPYAVVIDGRLWCICSHDWDGMQGWEMQAYTLLSTLDMVNWTNHGDIFKLKDVAWGMSGGKSVDAPALVQRNGKCYLYYPCAGDHISVAVADHPTGPYRDPLGKPLLDKSMPNCNVQWLFDPGVLIDDDGQAYLYFGGGEASAQGRVILLNEDMITTRGPAITIDLPGYLEAPFMHRCRGKYYLSYATHWNNARIDYGMSDNPTTGFAYQGTIVPELPDNMLDNSHGSIVEYAGRWYAFYHNRKETIRRGLNNRYNRTSNVDIMEYNPDGTIKRVVTTAQGVAQVRPFDPYVTIPATTIANSEGLRVAEDKLGKPYLSARNGEWLMLSGVDFGAGAREFIAQAACESTTRIEIRLDAIDGSIAGTCEIPVCRKWTKITAPLFGIKGSHDLYLRFVARDECELSEYRFSPS